MLLLLLFLCSPDPGICSPQPRQQNDSELITYRNLNELLDYFRNDPSPLGNLIVETFQASCRYPWEQEHPRLDTPRPFVVIEGNHRRNRDLVSKNLAWLLNARYVGHPAPCLRRYDAVLQKGTPLRRAFFHLSNYASAFYARSQRDKTIIINGYWTEQISFTVAHTCGGELPPVASNVFSWPEDLLRPDLIFYLDFPDTHINSYGTTRNPLSWKPRTMQVMRHLAGRYPILIRQLHPILKVTTEEICRHIREAFPQRLSAVWPRNNTTS